LKTSRVRLLAAALPLYLAAAAQGQTASLVRDINPTTGVISGSFPRHLQTALGRVFFTASGAGTGVELWATDGTDSGTRLVRDLCAGACDSFPEILGTLPGMLLFSARPEDGRPRLWRTDGTRAGTVALTGPELEVDLADVGSGRNVFLFWKGSLYFSGCDAGPTSHCELWRTDGTAAGTRLAVSTGSLPRLLTAAGDHLGVGTEDGFWTTDGTPQGTARLDALGGIVTEAAYVAGKLFLVTALTSGESLWLSDGTVAGTRRLRILSGDPSPHTFLKPGANGVYFLSDEGKESLWYSDGTTAGTRSLPVPALGRAEQLEEVGGSLVYFTVEAGSTARFWTLPAGAVSPRPLTAATTRAEPLLVKTGELAVFLVLSDHRQLWSTDGTAAGTRQVTNLCAGASRCEGVRGHPVAWQGAVLMIVDDGRNREELWKTDGTATGTKRLTGLPSDWLLHEEELWVATLGGKLIFTAGSPYGFELWVSEGPAATRKVTEIFGGGDGSNPEGLLAVGDQLYFHACDGLERTVWRSAGDEAGTASLGDVSGGYCNYYEEPDELAAAAGQVFFRKENGTLWRTDGTEAGTRQLQIPGSVVPGLADFQGRLFVSVRQEDSHGLWASDGTQAGTQQVLELPATSGPAELLTALGSELYFLAANRANPSETEVWRSDGTAAGTRRVAVLVDIYSGGAVELARVESRVYFTGAGRLWRTDGTSAGTAPIETLAGAEGYAAPSRLTAHQGVLYFLASAPSFRRGLWRTDGTSAGTVPLRLFPDRHGTGAQIPSSLVSEGGRLYFDADDEVHGVEPWVSDGTPAGTALVRDVFPGAGSSWPAAFAAAGGRIFFAARDDGHGVELWQSDGTEAGTRLVEDIVSMGSSYPEQLTATGNRLFFTADDGFTGRELWAFPLDETGCQPSARGLCLGGEVGGRFRVEAEWKDFQGRTGHGQAVAITADTGYFWFFDPANAEVIVKVLDGGGLNGHRWVFYGALSNVEYTLTVTDTQTGLTRRYFNPMSQLASVADTTAFGPLGAFAKAPAEMQVAAPSPAVLAGESTVVATGVCEPSAERLCLGDRRFAVEVAWKDFQGNTGTGKAASLTADTGYFWFFNAANVELVLKVLDGTPVNGRHWVFYGALSNVEYTITVTDTQTGARKTYKNPKGQLASVADTGAF
jgi:ELWxxDGT repeat protein